MKFSWLGLLQLKPFEETTDSDIAGDLYARSFAVTLGVVASPCLLLLAMILALSNHQREAIHAYAIGIGISAVVSGLEWNAGAKTRALNNLFPLAVVAMPVLFLLIGTH